MLRIRRKALLITLLVIVVLFICGKPVFETNDDMAIIALLSGQYGGIFTPDGIFISLLLGYPLSFLYSLNKSIPWYSASLYICQFVALYLAIKIILARTKGILGKICLVAGLVSIYSYMFYRLNFGSTSLFLIFVASMYLISREFNSAKVNIKDILLGVLVGVGYLIRPDVFFIGVAFAAPALLLTLVKNKKRLGYVVVPIVLLVALSLSANVLQNYRDPHRISFTQLQLARSQIMDTNRGRYTATTPAALAGVNWQPADYYLLRQWWTHDDSIYNTKTIDAFLAKNQGSGSTLFSLGMLKSSVQTAEYYLALLIIGLLAIVLFPILNAYPAHKGNTYYRRVAVFSVLVVTAGIVLLAGIRFPARIFIPVFIYFLLLVLQFYPFLQLQPALAGKKSISIVVMLFLLFAVTAHNWQGLKQITLGKQATKQYTETSFQDAQRIVGGKATFISLTIATVTETSNPWLEYRDVIPFNTVPSGWLIGSNLYYNYLKLYGLTSGKQLVPFSVNNPKVIYSFWQDGSRPYQTYIQYFQQQISQHYQKQFAKPIKAEVLLDRRNKAGGWGWIFFRLKTT